MLSARAYSLRRLCRLAISLSWIGGYTNAVALCACGTIVSHVTGTTTGLGRALAGGDFALARFSAFLLVTFFAGTLVSAVLLESARRRGSRSKYVLPIAVELALLLAFTLAFDLHRPGDLPSWGRWQYVLIGIASLAMGIQNATITKISGSVVRTTHVTGVVTDFGLEGVQYLYWWRDSLRGRGAVRALRTLLVSRRHPTARRLLLLASIFGSFLLGVTLGAATFVRQPQLVMVPVLLFLAWIVTLDLMSPIAELRELDALRDPELEAYGLVKSLLPPQVGIYRFASVHGGRAHRAPNFQLWVDRLPEHLRVVILALHPSTRFDANAVLDLELALQRLHTRGRKLILSGVTPAQYRSLSDGNLSRSMDFANLCPDLEFAIARAIAALHEVEAAGRPRKAIRQA